MLAILAALCSSIGIETCESPLKLADPPEGAKLLQVQVLIRHGARTPGEDFFNYKNMSVWHCDEPDASIPRYNPAPVLHPRNYRDAFDRRLVDYPPSCREKDLILLGMNQHFELGQLYRKRYIEELKALPENFDPDYFYGRASEADRTMKSAMAFMQGLFPPASPHEVIQIVTDNSAAGILHPNEDWCAEFAGVRDDVVNSEGFQKIWNRFTTDYKTRFEHLFSDWTAKNTKKFCSWAIMTACDGLEMPPEVDEDVQKQCSELLSYWHFGSGRNESKYWGVAAAPLFREMFRVADEAISLGSKVKFVLMSSHDTALAPFVSTLGWDFVNKPGIPVRSHVAFELWEINHDIYARVVFNGEPVPVSFMGGQTLYKYGALKTKMSRLGLLNHCFIPEWR